MKKTLSPRLVYLFVFTSGIFTTANAAPVLLNGSLTGTPGANTAATDWTIANATPDIVDANGPFNNTGVGWTLSPDGGTFARSNGTGDSVTQESFEQMVNGFIIGASYALDFYQTNLGFLAFGTEWRDRQGYWGLFVDDNLVGQSTIMSAPTISSDAIQWSSDSISFTATDTTQMLRLEAFKAGPAGASDFIAYIGIDGLQLTSAVPVPAAVWLFGSGLIGLIGIARRKKA